MNGGEAGQFDPDNQHHSLEGVLRATRITLLTCWIGGLFAPFAISGAFLYFQDGPLLLLQLILGGLALTPWGDRFVPRGLGLSFRAVAFIALAVLMFCYVGHYRILDGYDLSRDEQMTGFDMRIYAAHRLAWPLPTIWRGDAAALNLQFMLPVQHPVAWVSAYLPGNAMIRTLVGTIVDPALTGPIYTALSVLLLWGCARRIWPQDKAWDHEAATVAFLLLVLSGQVLFAGMTAFAMPAHLFVNLLWLWLFLADRRRTDLAALAVGFVGTGLHQPLFHPLFVLPFLVLLLSKRYWGRRRWGRLALFVGTYALIGAFWMWWPHYMHGLVAGPGSITDPGIGFIERLQAAVKQDHHPVPVMASNLLRFCTWQNVALLPLLIAGLWGERRDPMAMALAAGFLAPIVVMGVLLPYQGHGFGYRYLHGVIGNAALLGGYGWRWLAPWHVRARVMFMRAMLLSALLLLPTQGWIAHRFYTLFAQVSERITASGADYAVIGAAETSFAPDLVLNQPDLSNRPIRLWTKGIDNIDTLARRLCRSGKPGGVTVALPADSLFGAIGAYFHVPQVTANARLDRQRAAFEAAGCRVIVLR